MKGPLREFVHDLLGSTRARNRHIFDVLMNGQPLLSSFDIAADARGANTADIRAFTNVSPVNGYLSTCFSLG